MQIAPPVPRRLDSVSETAFPSTEFIPAIRRNLRSRRGSNLFYETVPENPVSASRFCKGTVSRDWEFPRSSFWPAGKIPS